MATISEVPAMILEQLGGAGKVKMMLGVKLFTVRENGVGIRFTARSKCGNHVDVELDESDTYTVKFFKIGSPRQLADCVEGIKPLKVFENIYGEDLKGIVEETLGLRLTF